MKKNILLLLIMAISVVAYGQKKPKINNALKSAQEGNLGEAKEIIDAAVEHEKTKDDPKTWYYRGLIYAALDTTQAPEYQNLANDALRTSMEAFNKATELNTSNNELYITNAMGLPELKSQQIQLIWGHYLNKGVIAFQDENTEDAVKYFEKCQVVLPKDTTCFIYAGLAAQSGEQYDVAAKNYYKLINELDHHNQDIYSTLIYIEANINKNDEKALELIRQAKEQFPNNTDYARSEINTLIRLERLDEAKSGLEKAIEEEPDNADLYFTLGVMHEEVGDKEKALEAYKNAVRVDPAHLNSNFNLGVLYFNEAVQIYKDRNNLGISSADQKKAKSLQVKADEKLNLSLPYWQKVLELDPSNRTAMEQMRYIYIQLKQNDKAEEIQNKMDEYGYSDEDEG